MSVVALGLNHVTAPLALRERFAFAGEALEPAVRALSSRFRHEAEIAIVSTCNRTELYLGAAAEAIAPAMDWLANIGATDTAHLERHAYVLKDADAARHAFRVASGLDSMVLGEPQILGQMKQAVRQAQNAGTLGGALHQMFQRSFTVAKEVRTSTCIGTQSVSMAAACVRLASQIFEKIGETRVLFVGAGEMIDVVATHFAGERPRAMAFANRTAQKAQALAARFDGEAMELADLPTRLADFDIVVSCTASSLPIIGLGAVESALKQRRRRPIFIADLAVPRDVEPEVGKMRDVYLWTVDDLATIVKANGASRQAAVVQAEAIVEHGVADFVRWLDGRAAVPLIRALRAQTDAWQQCELERARRAIARGDTLDTVLQSLTRGLAQKMLHGAMVEIHGGSAEVALDGAIGRIFNLRGDGACRQAPPPQVQAA